MFTTRKPYVYDPETVCLRLGNRMFTTRKPYVYDPETIGLRQSSGTYSFDVYHNLRFSLPYCMLSGAWMLSVVAASVLAFFLPDLKSSRHVLKSFFIISPMPCVLRLDLVK